MRDVRAYSDTSVDHRAVIVGAGIAGLAAAIELAESGIPVVILEKGVVGCEQSNYALGWIRTTGRSLPEVPLSLLNRECFDALVGKQSTGNYGIVYAAKNAEELSQLEGWANAVSAFGIATRTLGADATLSKLRGCTAEVAGALMTSVDTSVDPRHLVRLLRSKATALGVEIRTGCAVRSLYLEAGKARGVVTEAGVVRAATVVLATGAWTRLMLRETGYALPSVKVCSSLVRVRPHTTFPPTDVRCAAVAGIGLRVDSDGTLVAGIAGRSRLEITPDALRFATKFLPMWRAHRADIKLSVGRRFFKELMASPGRQTDGPSLFESERELRPQTDPRLAALTVHRLHALFPTIGAFDLVDSWSGYLDMTPDGMPVISSVPNVPDLYVSCGYSGSGLGTALGAGRLISRLVAADRAEIDPSPFRLDRWSRKKDAVARDGGAVPQPKA